MHKDNTIMTLDLDSIKPEEIKTLSSKEYLDILIKLQNFHTVFYKMWELGNISFSKDLKTAGILFNTEGECVEFKFNPDFWDQLSEYQRLFIICHECLHVILNHGYRLVSTHPLNRPVANIAADIVDNHILLDSFDFNREELGGLSKELCFIDTIFGENYKELRIEENGSMEYYFNKLKDNAIKIECFSTIDEHGIMNGEGADKGDSEEGSDSEKDSGSSKNNIPDYSKLFEKLGNSLTNEEKQELKKAIKTHDEGTKPGSKLAGTGIGKWY